MFTSLICSFAAIASVSALVVPRATPPAGWRSDILESYDVYNARYTALGCQNKHNQPFFDLCCHPLKADETLATARDPKCDPSKAAATLVVSAPAAAPTQAADENDTNDDDELPYCEDDGEDDDDSTPVATTIHTSTSTPKASPKPTSTVKETPQPATTQPKPTATSKPNVDDSANSADVVTGGFATFFYQNGVAGACGTVHSDSDFVAAMDYRRYGNLSAQSSLCGKKVKITNPANHKSVTVTVADACPTCNNANSIDLSVGAFTQIATKDQGLVGITWSFV